jgi:hypothetical protein
MPGLSHGETPGGREYQRGGTNIFNLLKELDWEWFTRANNSWLFNRFRPGKIIVSSPFPL